jgi:hypothetical protein
VAGFNALEATEVALEEPIRQLLLCETEGLTQQTNVRREVPAEGFEPRTRHL